MNLTQKLRKNLAVYLPSLESWALSGFDKAEIEIIAHNVAGRCGRDLSRPLVMFGRALSDYASNTVHTFAEDGEQALLDRLRSLPFRMVFDVGANVGSWSEYAFTTFPYADLHAFEIVPATFAELRSRLPEGPRIHLNSFGLSDAAGQVTVNLYRSSGLSSMFALDADRDIIGQVASDVQRGADYAAARGIERIDILKIDVEGAEGRVLSGFDPMVSRGEIRLIQFEYNRCAIVGDFLLKHAYAFFTARGYRLGKLIPDGVLFHPYHPAYEDFVGPNYVACRDDDTELIDAIAVRR